MFVRIIPFVIACLLLGAHFLRQGNLPLVGVCLLAPFLFFVKKRWALSVLQVFAYGSAAIWLYTTVSLVRYRMAIGAPWTRMSLILLGVTAFTLLAAYLISSDVLKSRYS
jgi:hypothetical protein